MGIVIIPFAFVAQAHAKSSNGMSKTAAVAHPRRKMATTRTAPRMRNTFHGCFDHAHQMISKSVLVQLASQVPVNQSWSYTNCEILLFATAGQWDDGVFDTCARVAERRTGRLTPQKLANTAWAIATTEWPNEHMFALLARAVERGVRGIASHDHASTAWEFAMADQFDAPLLRPAVLHSHDRQALWRQTEAMPPYFSLALFDRNKHRLRGAWPLPKPAFLGSRSSSKRYLCASSLRSVVVRSCASSEVQGIEDKPKEAVRGNSTFLQIRSVLSRLLESLEADHTCNNSEQDDADLHGDGVELLECTLRGFNYLAECRSVPGGGTILAAALESLCTEWSYDNLEKQLAPSLKLLSVGRNCIDEKGVEYLCRVVNPELRPHRFELVRIVQAYCNEPSLSWFGPFFSNILRGLPHLEMVDIGGMQVGDRAADAMAGVVRNDLSSDRYLRELQLDFLGLTSQSVPSLLYIIQTLKLNCIALEGNAIRDDELRLLGEACRKNRATWKVDPPPPRASLAAGQYEWITSISNPSASIADKVATCVIQRFLQLIPHAFLKTARGQLVVAGFVSYDVASGHLEVISIATGTSSVSYPQIGFCMDELVPDSHAEVLARRALLAHCYHQRNAGLKTIHDDTKRLYLYTSTAPCGYAKDGIEIGKDHKTLVVGCEHQRRSCLSKIRRWLNRSTGCAGKHPFRLPISGIVVGRKFKAWCIREGFMKTDVSLERVLSTRFGVNVNTSERGDSYASWYWFKVPLGQHEVYLDHHEKELRGISEFLDGRTGRRLDGRLSNICRSLISSV